MSPYREIARVVQPWRVTRWQRRARRLRRLPLVVVAWTVLALVCWYGLIRYWDFGFDDVMDIMGKRLWWTRRKLGDRRTFRYDV